MGPTRRARHKAPVEAGSKPSKHAGSDSEALWLRPVMAITTASVQQESDRVVCIYLPKPTPRIRFGSVLPKKARIALCKTGADPTWMACSGFGQTYLVRKQVGEQESSAPVLVERNRLATSFPTFRLGCTLPQNTPDLIVQNQPGSVLADCPVVAKRIRPQSRPVCKNNRARFWPSFRAGKDWLRIGSGMFTGNLGNRPRFGKGLIVR